MYTEKQPVTNKTKYDKEQGKYRGSPRGYCNRDDIHEKIELAVANCLPTKKTCGINAKNKLVA